MRKQEKSRKKELFKASLSSNNKLAYSEKSRISKGINAEQNQAKPFKKLIMIFKSFWLYQPN